MEETFLYFNINKRSSLQGFLTIFYVFIAVFRVYFEPNSRFTHTLKIHSDVRASVIGLNHEH